VNTRDNFPTERHEPGDAPEIQLVNKADTDLDESLTKEEWIDSPVWFRGHG